MCIIIFGTKMLKERPLTTDEYEKWHDKFNPRFDKDTSIKIKEKFIFWTTFEKEFHIKPREAYIGIRYSHIYNIPIRAISKRIVYYKLGERIVPVFYPDTE